MSVQKKIVQLCEDYGYGRVMEVTSKEWSKKADSIDLSGSHFVVGPCGSQVEPCECDPRDNCVWCCGSGWLTNHVKSVKTAREE